MRRRKVDLRSITVAIALRLGFLDVDQAREADEAVNESTPTLSLLVERGYLNRVQAEMVREEREKTSPLEHLSEYVKRARCAVQNSWKGAA